MENIKKLICSILATCFVNSCLHGQNQCACDNNPVPNPQSCSDIVKVCGSVNEDGCCWVCQIRSIPKYANAEMNSLGPNTVIQYTDSVSGDVFPICAQFIYHKACLKDWWDTTNYWSDLTTNYQNGWFASLGGNATKNYETNCNFNNDVTLAADALQVLQTSGSL